MERKRRWKERGKTLLILLLSVSAVYLLALTPLVQDSGVVDMFVSRGENGGAVTSVTLTAAARPSRLAVNSEEGRYGVQYDQAGADELFVYLGPLLGEALVTSGQPMSIAEYQWRSALQMRGIYFDFSGSIPLSALGGWLQQKGTCGLNDSARRILLTEGSGDRVLLWYQSEENGKFYRCDTGLSMSLHLLPAIKGVVGNGAYFAFEGGEWEAGLQPYTLITEDVKRVSYSAVVPLAESGALSHILEALSYTGRNHASVSGGELYLDGNDRLYILNNGCVTFDAAQAGKYPVAAAEDTVTVAETIEAARDLAENTIGLLCGDAELYLVSAETTANGYCVRFGYRLDGSTVWLYDEGWAAEFYAEGGYLTRFTLYFRRYTGEEEQTLLLPMDKAAAVLTAMTNEQLELVSQYRDHGESVVEPVWVAQ